MLLSCMPCDEIDCFSRVAVGIGMDERRALTPGEWTFTFVLDEDDPITTTCTIGAFSRSARCDDEGGISAVIFDDPDNPYTRFLVSFDGEPETIAIHVELAGTTVHDRSHEPHYEPATMPRRCDPDCLFASIDVVIDPS